MENNLQMKKPTTSALCSKKIKQDLKNAFPNVKFSVKSDNFSGGNSVDITWIDGVTYDMVEKVVKKYQYGNFDGMTDSYNVNNQDTSIPQVMFVQCQRSYSNEIIEKTRKALSEKYGVEIQDNKWFVQGDCWGSTLIYTELNDKNL